MARSFLSGYGCGIIMHKTNQRGERKMAQSVSSSISAVLLFVVVSLAFVGILVLIIKASALLYSKLFHRKAGEGASRKKRVVIVGVVAVVYYAALFIFRFTISQNFMLYPANYQLSENCIIVHGQAVTGPQIRVEKGAEFLLSSIPPPYPDDLNVDEIEMTGKSIYTDILGYPDYYACDWLVYGVVTGTTDQYAICGSGTVPVFEAEKVQPIMSLSQFLSLEVILFERLPFGLMTALLYLWPIAAFIVAVSKKTGLPRKQRP
jgi:hypothetical protein